MQRSAHIEVSVAVAPIQETIHEILSRPNPIVSNVVPRPSRSVLGATWVDITPDNITPWNDFTYENIAHAFGDILEIALDKEDTEERRDPVHVRRVPDVRALGPGYFFRILSRPIAEGSRVLGRRLGSPLPAVGTGEDQTVRSGQRTVRCGLAFFFDQPVQTYLVTSGIKVSNSWISNDLTNNSTDESVLAPMSQVATYARVCRTRYTFVLTDEEFVAVRISCDHGGVYKAEWKAISWNASGENTLTIGIAMWALVMMALNRRHRGVRSPQRTLPLNLWWRYCDAAGGVYYRHHLSLRRRRDLPDGAVCEDGPFA
ncbi:hypothetical protein QQZ08_012093 [Neonectria magnoliae]|uniref:Uncharacterized protein n=1 Tax=Neonectria magnoliae TaxID=2732573 RepID=A0ABR1H531_9HYPO